MDYVDSVLEDVSGGGGGDGMEEAVWGLVEVGALEEVGAQRMLATQGRQARAAQLAQVLGKTPVGSAMPSPPFARSARDTTRRAPLGFVEDGSGAFFFSLAAAIGATTTIELSSVDALTDTLPDNFSPLGPALDFVVVLFNTTAAAVTGTIGIKAAVDR